MERMVQFIPAEQNITSDGARDSVRVAAYARVSSLPQEESYESQVEHFTTLIGNHPEWDLIRVYGDEGVSGLGTKKRDGFNDMIRDGKRKKYDKLLVKSISRMGRNTVDLLNAIRELRAVGVGVYFEKENIDTLETTGELMITLMSAFAQAESESISGNVRLGLEYRMKRGEWSVAFSNFLGYDRDADGNVVIVPEQAETVRRIYDLFLSGLSLREVAEALEAEGRLTGAGNSEWRKDSITDIIKNIKYSGTVILQKTYTADVLTKQRKRNKGEVPQYRVENGIPAIIDKQTWLLAQAEYLRRSRLAKGIDAPGPRERWGHNDFSSLIFCPDCGAFLNRHMARKTRIWKCRNRAVGSGCKCEIIKEEELQIVTLEAAQALWDKQPNVRHWKVEELTENTSEEKQIEVAAVHAENMRSDRIAEFLKAPRPIEYTSDIPNRLIERIDFNDREWTFRFWGRQTIKVERQPVGETRDQGRKLKRSGRPIETPKRIVTIGGLRDE